MATADDYGLSEMREEHKRDPWPCPSCAAKDAEIARLEKECQRWIKCKQRKQAMVDDYRQRVAELEAEVARLRHVRDAVDWLLTCAYIWRGGSPVIPADNWAIFVAWCGGTLPPWKQTAPPTGA